MRTLWKRSIEETLEKMTWNMSVMSLGKGWVVSRVLSALESKITGKRKARDVVRGSSPKEGAESS